MYKLQTKTFNFRYGSILRTKPLLVTWFKLEKTDVGECFSDEEVIQFINFVESRKNNFDLVKKFDCSANSADFSFNSIYYDQIILIPKLLVLTKNPFTYKSRNCFECMDII